MKSGNRWFGILAVLVLAIASVPAYAQAKASAMPRLEFKDIKLKNGLRVLLVEDHSAPVISLALDYDVGSRNERQGRTGFAHLFEHMMFQGSENVGKSEHFLLVMNNGGNMNGTTNEERTLYFETLPANQLDLLLFLESDRMKGLDISSTNLENQRNAVQEERRLGLDNQPYGKMNEKFGETMYDNFAYKHSVIGSMADLDAATVDDVKDFFRIYYAPNNAIIALVGDFKTEDALARVKKYFESIPSQPAAPPVDTAEPAQTAERRFTVEDPLAQLPLLAIGYKTLPGNTPDSYALQLLASVLGTGQSSRLYQSLVKEKQLATQIFSNSQARRGPGRLQINALVAPGKKSEDVEAAVYDEIAKIQQNGVTAAELEKAKTLARRGLIQSRQQTLAIAIGLVEATVEYNDPNLVNERYGKINAVTLEDLKRVANKYLLSNNRTVGLAQPKPKAQKAQTGQKAQTAQTAQTAMTAMTSTQSN
jgi:predicted Zn-dependent peptidase